MAGREVLVTGSTGFIGRNLVRRLVESGHGVTCLIRSKTRAESLGEFGVDCVEGDIADLSVLKQAIAGKDWVFHLAGAVNFLNRENTLKTNTQGTDNLLSACISAGQTPTIIYVSSLAAVGPSPRGTPHQESVVPRPISIYGESKLKAEQLARQYASRVPISIVRPPVVLGPNDPNSLQLFQIINQWRLHFIPGYIPQEFSVIHVEDLVDALVAVAEGGKRIVAEPAASGMDSSGMDSDQGIYFAASDEIVTFGELGKMIGQALGKNWILRVPTPRFSISMVGALNSTLNGLLKTRLFLTMDKAREATAGSWACSNEKLKRETGWRPGAPLLIRLQQTAEQFKRQSLPLPRPAP
jgi:nucleoside-diphosphate-sugar epimerase